MVKFITKRDGRRVPYELSKIKDAILLAAVAVGEGNANQDAKIADEVANLVDEKVNEKFTSKKYPSVEEVQDIVEQSLIEKGYAKVAKEYILYRAERNRTREMNAELMQTFKEITLKDAKDSDLKRENGNINADTSMGMMLKYGSEAAKEFNHLYLLDKDVSEAHKSGDIHIHDLDFLGIGTLTCVQDDLDKLFENGFSTGHGFLREPNSIRSYASLTAIALQCSQNEMHGGQSIPFLDFYLSKGVAKTYIKEILDILVKRFDIEIDSPIYKELKEKMKGCLKKYNYHIIKDKGNQFIKTCLKDANLSDSDIERVLKLAFDSTEEETHQAMESLVHNLNSMHSRAGSQVPFTSLNFGTDISEEGRMVSRNLLRATEEGLGDGETAIFPISIFRVMEGVNYNPEDPNYDLFKQSMRVSAKRLFPTYNFQDAPFNKQYLTDDWHSQIATMGCVDGIEMITYKYKNTLFVESFERAWNRISNYFQVKQYGDSEYCDVENIYIYDSSNHDFVKCKKFIRNPDKGNWYRLVCNGGRTILLTEDHPLHVKEKGRVLLKDICVGDKIAVSKEVYNKGNKFKDVDEAWTLGLTLCDGKYEGGLIVSLGLDERDIAENYQRAMYKQGYDTEIIERHRGSKGDYLDIVIRGIQKPYCDSLYNLYGGYPKRDRCVPSEVFTWNEEARRAFMCGMIDADGGISHRENRGSRIQIGSVNPEIALGQMLLANSLGLISKVYVSRYCSNHDGLRYRVEFPTADWMLNYLTSQKKRNKIIQPSQSKWSDFAKVTNIEELGFRGRYSYDVETVSDRFDVSGFASHNCRTRVISNVYNKKNEVVSGRGNLSFTSINLPRLGIEAKGDIDKFFELLDEKMYLVKRQLIKRMKYQCTKHVYNFPFLMGQGIWTGSEKLGPEDTLESIVNEGSLSIGFIGLAECLVALIGKHHGESDEAQELGLKIIGHMRDLTDAWQKEWFTLSTGKKVHLNWGVLGTPAEGLSGTFVRKDKKKYGIIKGVTDRDYYTNSSHVPVYYSISFIDKIKKEAPYHALENAGHICYIEFDGDATQNLEAFEAIIRCMKENGVGYGAVNLPVDRDPVCGYTGIIGDICPKCGRDTREPITQEEINKIRKKFGLVTPFNLSHSCSGDC